jgi:hypothetical protein
MFDAWSDSITVGSKRGRGWNNSTHTPSWPFYLHYGIEETASAGMICIDCHPVLCHPSEDGSSSLGKHLLAKAHIAKIDEFPESQLTDLTSCKSYESVVGTSTNQVDNAYRLENPLMQVSDFLASYI